MAFVWCFRAWVSTPGARLEADRSSPAVPWPEVQAIRSRGQQPRLYVSFPLALAAAIDLEPGETVQWELLDRRDLHLVRVEVPLSRARRRARQS